MTTCIFTTCENEADWLVKVKFTKPVRFVEEGRCDLHAPHWRLATAEPLTLVAKEKKAEIEKLAKDLDKAKVVKKAPRKRRAKKDEAAIAAGVDEALA